MDLDDSFPCDKCMWCAKFFFNRAKRGYLCNGEKLLTVYFILPGDFFILMSDNISSTIL